MEPGSLFYQTHVLQLLKPSHPTARALQQEKPLQWEARTPQCRGAPLTSTRGSPLKATKIQSSQKSPTKNKSIKLSYKGRDTSCENERNPSPLLLGKLEGPGTPAALQEWSASFSRVYVLGSEIPGGPGLRDPRRSMCTWVARIYQLLPVHFLMFKTGKSNLRREVLEQQMVSMACLVTKWTYDSAASPACWTVMFSRYPGNSRGHL